MPSCGGRGSWRRHGSGEAAPRPGKGVSFLGSSGVFWGYFFGFVLDLWCFFFGICGVCLGNYLGNFCFCGVFLWGLFG